jgi:hypothetical protein
MTHHRRSSILYGLLAALPVAALGAILLLWLSSRTQDPPDVLFRLSGHPYTVTDLSPEYRQALTQTRRHAYLVERSLLEGAAVDAYITSQSERQARSRASLEAHLFDPTPPTSAAVAAFYAANQERIGTGLEQAREAIAHYLLSRRRQRERAELVAKLAHLGELEINLPAPPPGAGGDEE